MTPADTGFIQALLKDYGPWVAFVALFVVASYRRVIVLLWSWQWDEYRAQLEEAKRERDEYKKMYLNLTVSLMQLTTPVKSGRQEVR